ncbi:BnaC03g61600D [Brassica napus]|uniref:BnaC03g61600D protein n=1 Tax=Brassica napus TaxID=3708 RepID=A0A078GBJ4_BRANA|nr:BnaC03g61600D [Brassica napus]
MVLMVKAPPPSRCRPPPDPPPSKLLSVAFETLTSIIPPEPPDPPDSFFVLVHRLRPLVSFSNLAINSIGSAASPRPPYLSNKPCEGIVYVPLWNKSFLRKVHCDVCLLKLYLPQCEDVTLFLTLRMRSSLPLGHCVEDGYLRCRNYDLTSSFSAIFDTDSWP